MNVFIDTNVVMDVLLRREPFFVDAQKIWLLAERGKVRGLVSAMTFPNIYYIVRKLKGVREAEGMLRMLRGTFVAAPLDDQIIGQAIEARFKDFEDALQYFSALKAEAQCVVSRNPDHFPQAGCPVLGPGEFLGVHSFE